MPDWLTHGLVVGSGMVVAVGYAMIINMMATREVLAILRHRFCFWQQLAN